MLSRRLEGKAEDVRSGIFGAIAEWAASKVVTLGHMSVRTWKPRLLVPFEDPDQLRGSIRPVLDLALPEGSVKLLAIATERSNEQLTDCLLYTSPSPRDS